MGALPLLDPGQEPDETLTALHKAVVDSAYDVINLKVGSVLWFVVGFVSLFQAACSLLVAFLCLYSTIALYRDIPIGPLACQPPTLQRRY